MTTILSRNQQALGSPDLSGVDGNRKSKASAKKRQKHAENPDDEIDGKPRIKLVPPIDPRFDQDDLKSKIRRAYELSTQSDEQRSIDRIAWYDAYVGNVEPKNIPWDDCSNLHIPITATIVDTFLARLINPLFANSPVVQAQGLSNPNKNEKPVNQGGKESDQAIAEKIQGLMHYTLDQRMKIYRIVLDWVKEALIYGNGYIKIYWEKRERRYTQHMGEEDLIETIETLNNEFRAGRGTEEKMKLMETMNMIFHENDWDRRPFVKVPRAETVYDLPVWEFIPSEDFLKPPRCRDIYKAPYLIHRFHETLESLQEKEYRGIYENVDSILVETSNSNFTDRGISLEQVQLQDEGESNLGSPFDVDGYQDIELLNFHGKYRINPDDELMITVDVVYNKESDVLLSARESNILHGKYPFSEINLFPMPGRSHGRGIPEIIAPLQEEINAIHNQRIDNGTLANSIMFMYDPDSDIDPGIHKIEPGAGFPARPDQFRIITPPEVKASSFREEEIIRKLIQDLTSIADLNVSASSGAVSNKTATGISTVVQEGNIRQENTYKNVLLGMNEAVLQTFQLLQQFGPDELFYQAVEQADQSIRTISSKDIQGQFDISMSAQSISFNKTLALNEALQQADIAQRLGPSFVNITPIAKEIFLKLGSKRINEIVVPLEEAFLKFVKDQGDPNLILQVKQQIDQLAQQVQQETQAGPGKGNNQPQFGPGSAPVEDIINQFLPQLAPFIKQFTDTNQRNVDAQTSKSQGSPLINAQQ